MDVNEIMAMLQHRYPFLLVDRIVELELGIRVVGLKNVTINEPFFQGHFPHYPVMPGVLILEHAAQIGCALLLTYPANADKLGLFTGMTEVAFNREVIPGDQLVTEVTKVHLSSRAGKVRFVSRVNGELAAEGYYTFILVPDPVKKKAAEPVGVGT